MEQSLKEAKHKLLCFLSVESCTGVVKIFVKYYLPCKLIKHIAQGFTGD